MNIFDIFAAASFEYAVYSNLAVTDPNNMGLSRWTRLQIAVKGITVPEDF